MKRLAPKIAEAFTTNQLIDRQPTSIAHKKSGGESRSN